MATITTVCSAHTTWTTCPSAKVSVHLASPPGCYVYESSGLVYTCLMEKVFKFSIHGSCKKRLKSLRENDAIYMAKVDRNNLTAVQNKDLAWLCRYFQHQEIVAMSWTLYHNAPLHVHRYEKRSKPSKPSVECALSIDIAAGVILTLSY